MMQQLEGGDTIETTLTPDGRKVELAVDSGNEWINAVNMSAADLHQLAYRLLGLANEIRSVPGRG